MVGEKLTSDAMLDEVLCVCPGCQPIETCTEGLAYKGSSCGVVAAESGMNFLQELSPFLFGDTSLKYSGSVSLIEFSIMDFIGFRAPNYASCLVSILGEFLPIKVG